MVSFRVSGKGVEITADMTFIGKDLIVVMSGGDVPHVGTVTTWSIDEKKSTTIQFPSHSGRYHKDHILAELVIEKIKSDVVGNVVITSGVHIDGIRPEQIQESLSLAVQLGQKIKAWVNSNSITYREPIYKKRKLGSYET
ncbi:TPA: amino acid decarboxylase [Streptococcus suis]|nr:amino acid decarboxylase [Streptococcus suis]